MSRQTLPWREKAAYLSSNIATAFSWGYITSYFMIFCTDAVGISAYAFSVLLLVSRLFDGVTDPLVGYITDRTVTRWGRYRPWIAASALPVALATCLLFYQDPAWNPAVRFAWVCGAYLLYLLVFTVFSTPLDAMASVMSGSPDARANIISLKSAAGIVGAMVMTQLATVWFDAHGTDQAGTYFQLTVLFGLVSVPLYLLTPIFCKEKILPAPKKQQKFHLGAVVRQNISSQPFRIALAGHFLNGLISYGRVSIFVYYFKYVAGDMALYALFTLLMRLPQIAGTYLAQYILPRFRGPGQALSCLYVLYGGTLVLNFFVLPRQGSMLLFWGLTIVSSFLFGASFSLIYTIVPDLTDYSEYLSGARSDGGVFALLEFGNKVGMAIGTSGMGIVLGVLGFSANMPQTPGVLWGINALMFIAPGVLAILIGLLFLRYRLDRTILHANDRS